MATDVFHRADRYTGRTADRPGAGRLQRSGPRPRSGHRGTPVPALPQQTQALLDRPVADRALSAWHLQRDTDEVHWQPVPPRRAIPAGQTPVRIERRHVRICCLSDMQRRRMRMSSVLSLQTQLCSDGCPWSQGTRRRAHTCWLSRTPRAKCSLAHSAPERCEHHARNHRVDLAIQRPGGQ
jgi:hypothetical protein